MIVPGWLYPSVRKGGDHSRSPYFFTPSVCISLAHIWSKGNCRHLASFLARFLQPVTWLHNTSSFFSHQGVNLWQPPGPSRRKRYSVMLTWQLLGSDFEDIDKSEDSDFFIETDGSEDTSSDFDSDLGDRDQSSQCQGVSHSALCSTRSQTGAWQRYCERWISSSRFSTCCWTSKQLSVESMRQFCCKYARVCWQACGNKCVPRGPTWFQLFSGTPVQWYTRSNCEWNQQVLYLK